MISSFDTVNLLLIGFVICVFGLFLYFKLSNPKAVTYRTLESPEHRYTIEKMILYVKQFLHEHVNGNLYELGLSGEELRRRNNKRLELKRALKGCVYGDLRDKNFVKDFIKDLLSKTYGIHERTINWAIPFEREELLTDQDRFEIILFCYKKKFQYQALAQLIQKYKLDRTKKLIEDGQAASYIITGEEIREIYQKEIRYLSLEDKLQIIVQRIYQSYKGFGVIDEIRDMNIDGVSGGISGVPSGFANMPDGLRLFADQLNEYIPQAHDSVWIFYKGKSIHLSFLSFGSELELRRICQNIYKYNNPGQLSESTGYKVNEMKDGSRVVVLRPNFAESWAFFVRKFDIPRATLEMLIQDRNADLAIGLLKFLVKGARIMAITGQQGSGKTTLLMAMVKHIYATLTLRVQEMAFELHLRKIYPYRNILSLRETDHIKGQDGLDVQKKTDGAVNIVGEAATDPVAAWVIQTSQVASLFTLFTHHAKTFSDLIFALRNSLLKIGVFSNEKIAEKQVVHVINFDIHLRLEKNGHRYIERITECVPLESEAADDANPKTFEGRNILEFRNGAYVAVHPISERSVQEMSLEMNEEDARQFQSFVQANWGR